MASSTTNRLRSTWLRCTPQILHHSIDSFDESRSIDYANMAFAVAGKGNYEFRLQPQSQGVAEAPVRLHGRAHLSQRAALLPGDRQRPLDAQPRDRRTQAPGA